MYTRIFCQGDSAMPIGLRVQAILTKRLRMIQTLAQLSNAAITEKMYPSGTLA
jgi:hypothetical protein